MKGLQRLGVAVLLLSAGFGVYVGAREAYNGYKYQHEAHIGGIRGMDAFMFLAAPVKLKDGRTVSMAQALSEIVQAQK